MDLSNRTIYSVYSPICAHEFLFMQEELAWLDRENKMLQYLETHLSDFYLGTICAHVSMLYVPELAWFDRENKMKQDLETHLSDLIRPDGYSSLVEDPFDPASWGVLKNNPAGPGPEGEINKMEEGLPAPGWIPDGSVLQCLPVCLLLCALLSRGGVSTEAGLGPQTDQHHQHQAGLRQYLHLYSHGDN